MKIHQLVDFLTTYKTVTPLFWGMHHPTMRSTSKTNIMQINPISILSAYISFPKYLIYFIIRLLESSISFNFVSIFIIYSFCLWSSIAAAIAISSAFMSVLAILYMAALLLSWIWVPTWSTYYRLASSRFIYSYFGASLTTSRMFGLLIFFFFFPFLMIP